ncbi:hypothetical protein EVAR_64979_1 [Eumeta japonica]|uniref:Uncharacterized protein n=1 Tax=Eumeta variegata TaxID=151549 RepID=A0A4C1ZZC9_EUMVA|nr:hypothetical protein EVAR_64979_1 [Eumeta japonica]
MFVRLLFYRKNTLLCTIDLMASCSFSLDTTLEAFRHNPTDVASYHCSLEQVLCHSSRSLAWVNNPTLGEFCFTMIGRADIEGSKSDVAMNAWPPQASYPCGNFSDTSC